MGKFLKFLLNYVFEVSTPLTYTLEEYTRTLVEYVSEKARLDEKVKSIISRILLPKRYTGQILRRYVRKALINKSWYTLLRIERLLLWLTSKIVSIVKSPILKRVIDEIVLKIELASLKGKALYYGVLLLIKKLKRIEEILENIVEVLYTGISYINNPPLYRVYG